MTKTETKLKLKQAKTKEEYAQTLLAHFRSQSYYFDKLKKLATPPLPEDILDTLDGKLL